MTKREALARRVGHQADAAGVRYFKVPLCHQCTFATVQPLHERLPKILPGPCQWVRRRVIAFAGALDQAQLHRLEEQLDARVYTQLAIHVLKVPAHGLRAAFPQGSDLRYGGLLRLADQYDQCDLTLGKGRAACRTLYEPPPMVVCAVHSRSCAGAARATIPTCGD